jgi:hypothetical protein
MVWDHLGLPRPTSVQLDIAEYLQHGPKRMIVSAFRGVGKSWETSAFALWLLYCDPQRNILVVSASKNRADSFSTFAQQLINEMPLLSHLKPREGQRSSKIEFDVGPAEADHAASVRSAGITGQITGARADVIVADDVEVPKNSATQAQREKLSTLVKEFDAILKPLPSARIIFLGTPQSEQTVYLGLEPKGFETRIWPARYPTPKQVAAMGARLAPRIREALAKDPKLAGRPVDPKRFAEADLRERELSMGKSSFALQYMLDTSLSDADRYPLKLSDLIVFDCAPDKAPVDIVWASDNRYAAPDDVPNVGFNGDRFYMPMTISQDWSPYQSIVMALDPAGRGGDEVGYAVVAFHYGRLYVLDAGGLKGGYADDNLTQLATLAKSWKVNLIVEEPNFGDGLFGKVLRPFLERIYPCTIVETERSSTQKEVRIIDTLEPIMNQHRLIVNKALIKRDFESVSRYSAEEAARYRLFYQLTRITKERGSLAKDDRVDALSLVVHYYRDRMDRDVAKAQSLHREKLVDAELQQYMKHVLGRAVRKHPNFIRR